MNSRFSRPTQANSNDKSRTPHVDIAISEALRTHYIDPAGLPPECLMVRTAEAHENAKASALYVSSMPPDDLINPATGNELARKFADFRAKGLMESGTTITLTSYFSDPSVFHVTVVTVWGPDDVK